MSAAEVVSGFLWLPKRIGGEWRWLRRATWLRLHGSSWDGIFSDDVRWLDAPTPPRSVMP